MSFSARMVGVVILLLLSFRFFTFSASAQTTTLSQSQFMQVGQGVPINISTLTQGIFMGFLSSATCVLGGIDFMSSNRHCLTYDIGSGKIVYEKGQSGGLLGLGTSGLALTYTNPIHLSNYFAYTMNNFGLVKKTFAATTGIGFDQLEPVARLWLAFRNLTFLLFVVVFVIVGFAVMLRAKIDPRTVMTIENQLPKLVIALILISFSFAIAGLVIDIMWVGIYLVINLFGNLDSQLTGQIGSLTNAVKATPFDFANALNSGFGGFLGIAGQASTGVGGISATLATDFFKGIGVFKYLLINIISLPIMLGCLITSIPQAVLNNFGPAMDSCVSSGFGNVVGGVMLAIAFLIFAVALFVAIARVWWQLIKAYTLFLIFTIAAPFMIMLGVLPGSKTNFEYWLRHIIAYTICFPTVMAIFLLGKTFMDLYSTKATTTVPPLLGVGFDPKVLTFLGPLLGFAVIMLIPQAVSLVQEALAAPDPKFLAGIGQAIGVGVRGTTGLGVQQVRRAFRPKDLVQGLDEGWARRMIPPSIKNIIYGRPLPKTVEQGSGHGNPSPPAEV